MSENKRFKLSVIILVYNAEQYISACVDSLLGQTLDDIEYIFVDDCSTDRSIEILKERILRYPERKNSIKIILNEYNRGQAISRMRALDYIHGDYVIACDSDDYLDVNAYEILYNKAVQYNLDIVAFDFNRVYKDKTIIDSQRSGENPQDWIKDILMSNKMGSLCNHLIRHDLLTDIVAPASNVMEDTCILIQALIRSKTIGYVGLPLYNYVQHIDSTTASGTKETVLNQIAQMDKNIAIIGDILKNNEMNLQAQMMYRYLFLKNWSLPIISSLRDCSIWINIHKEINYRLFFNPHISIRAKFISLMILMRLYPILKKLRHS